MTAELMTIFFSHPNADGFWHWSFIDRAKRSKRKIPHALFSYDGQARPEMEQWIKMMEDDFNTDKTIRTDHDGRVALRGFKGIYKITVDEGAQARSSIVCVEEDSSMTLMYGTKH
jgi:hypothetical protein